MVLSLLLVLDSVNGQGGSVCCPPTLHLCGCPRLWLWVGKGVRRVGWGGGEPGACPPIVPVPAYTQKCVCAHTHTHTHTHTRAHEVISLPFLFISFSFSFQSLSALSSFLSLPLSFLLFLFSNFISLGLFWSLLSLSLPYSSFSLSPFPFSWHLLSLWGHLPPQPSYCPCNMWVCVHTLSHTIFFIVPFLRLNTKIPLCCNAYSIQYSSMLNRFVA